MRDPRILLHSMSQAAHRPARWCCAAPRAGEPDRAVQRRYAAAVAARLGWQPVVGRFELFAVEIDDVASIGHTKDNAQHVARWLTHTEYLRAPVTPTPQAMVPFGPFGPGPGAVAGRMMRPTSRTLRRARAPDGPRSRGVQYRGGDGRAT
jgi:hypothetical protein